MEKFSVKKPFTVLVAVIMVIMLGLVSVQNMQTNLLPNVNTPYLMVVTVYPGASAGHHLGREKRHRHLGRKLQSAADGV